MNWSNDLHQAGRRLARRPGFLILGALGLGAGLAGVALVFALLGTFVLRPLPGAQPATPAVELGRVSRGHFDSLSWPDLLSLREGVSAFDEVFGYRTTAAYLQRDGEAWQVGTQLVSGNFFTALGVSAQAGQLISPVHDGVPGSAPVVVASHAGFQRWFGGDRSRLGEEVLLNGARYTLIGVSDAAFRGTELLLQVDFFVPLVMAPTMNLHAASIFTSRGSRWLRAGATLDAGASPDLAREQLAALGRNLAQAHPDSNHEVGFDLAPLGAVPHEARKVVGIASAALLVLCAAVLVLAASNLGGVMLAQGQARRAELAMRSVLGASRARLTRQLTFEALGVGLLAALFGIGLAWLARGLLNQLPLPSQVPVDLTLSVDWRVMLATAAVALLVALGFGLLPALRVAADAPARGDALRDATGTHGLRQRGRHLLLAVQACLTVTLLVVAGLVLRSVQDAAHVDTGYRTQGVYYATLDLEPLGVDAVRGSEALNRVAASLRGSPGIEAAGFATVVPLTLSSVGYGGARRAGDDGDGIQLDVSTVGEGYLATLGVEVRGRDILASDGESAERVAVINASTARSLFGDSDAIGQTFELGGDDDWQTLRVVGVVPDGRYSKLDDAGKAFAYLPAGQWRRAEFHLFVRSLLAPAALAERIQTALGDSFSGLPRPPLQRFDAAARLSVMPQILLAGASSALGLLGLLLAATGLYGVLALQVAARTRELGVRRALGASAVGIAGSLLRRTLWVVGGGALIGLVLGQGAGVLLGSALFGIRPLDPLANAGVVLLFLLMVLAAAATPLLRALRLPPSQALRYD